LLNYTNIRSVTTYLTKTENGQLHHFRATVEETGVEMVQGVFYNWLNRHWHNYDNEQAALAAQKELVASKLAEGFIMAEYEPIPENTIDVYDKAKWHFGGDFPEGLDAFQGYVHTGMFVGWLIDHELVSAAFKKDFAAEINSFRQQQHTGAQIYQSCCDGALMLEDLNETGNRFALAYFNFDTGEYLSDYEATLGMDVPTIYHVKDTWSNYQKLKVIIDFRFDAWLKQP
jgi:hypothetical protein